VLGYLNVRPRTTYAGRVRNRNPRMPGYTALPASRIEYQKKNEPQGQGHGHGGHDTHGKTAPAAGAEKKGAH